MSDLKAYILFPIARKHPLYRDWLDRCPIDVVVVDSYDTQWMAPVDAGIVITHLHYRWEEITVLRRIVEADRIPVLVLADGIIEYRNTFENPGVGDGAVFQPLVGHKLACLGRSQARWIEAWGNVGKCEVVGLPQMDHMLRERETAAGPPPVAEDEFRLLVSSARTPFFNDQQRQETMRAFGDLRATLEGMTQIDGRKLHVQWRVSQAVIDELQLPADENARVPLQTVLEKTDAVISTPSTVQLEAALNQLPTAVLDYHNCPHFVPAAWSISCRDQMDATMRELAHPNPAKMLVQEALLHDNLYCRPDAADRMIRLVECMVDAGREARKERRALSLPPRVLTDENDGFAAVSQWSRLSQLFPDNSAFQDQSVSRLQTELSAAVSELGRYPEKYFAQRNANRRSRSYINWLRTMLRNRGAMIENLLRQNNELKTELAKRSVKNG